MSTSIGRSLRIPCYLLGCLALSVVGGRADEPAGTAQGPTPPVPSKQTPATPPVPSKQIPFTTNPCTSCPGTFPPSPHQVPIFFPLPQGGTWSDQTPFTVILFFTSQTDYFNFKKNPNAYLCFTPPAANPPNAAWLLIPNSGVFDDSIMRCKVSFMACDPLRGMERFRRIATGTGRIIVTSDATVGVHDQYQAGIFFGGLVQQ